MLLVRVLYLTFVSVVSLPSDIYVAMVGFRILVEYSGKERRDFTMSAFVWRQNAIAQDLSTIYTTEHAV
jgi:hypothetical protein